MSKHSGCGEGGKRMEGLIEVRFFMALSELVKKRQWENPLRLALEEETTGVALLAKL